MIPLKIAEIQVKSILNKPVLSESSVLTGPGVDYTLDPYVGCQHACKYCYVFRKQFIEKGDESHANDFWGEFVDPKINAATILENELKGAKRGSVFLSPLTDPYQPLEHKYRITRECLQKLQRYNFKPIILTKSDLVNRDLDILSKMHNAEVGISITTDDDSVREIIEPHSSSIEERIYTLKNFHSRKIKTYVHIGPILPMNTADLIDQVADHVDYAIIEKMTYISSDLEELYQRNGFDYALEEEYFKSKEAELRRILERKNIRIW